MRTIQRLVSIALAAGIYVFSSCGDQDGAGAGDAGIDAGDTDTADDALPPICFPEAAPWEPGTPIFTESAADWGLAELGLVAQRFHVADIDNDGWPDVLARLSSGADDFNP